MRRRSASRGNRNPVAGSAMCRRDRGVIQVIQYHALSVTVALSDTSQLASASRSTC